MKQLFSYLKKFKAKIYISIFLIFLVALTSAAVVIYEGKYVIDYIKTHYNDGMDEVKFLKTLGIALLGNLLLYVMATIGRFIYNKLLITAIHSSVKDLREDLHKKIHRLPIKFFDQNAVGNVMSIITNDVEMVANGLQQSTISLICAFFNMILIIIVMFWANLPLGILVSLMIPSALIVIFIMNKKSRNIFIQRYEKTGEYVGFLQEKYTGHKEIALFNQQENVIQEFEEINTELTQNIFKSNFISGLVMPIVSGFTYIMVSLVVIVGIVLMRGETEVNNHFLGKMGFGVIQLGLFQGFIQYVWRLGHPINDLSQIFVVLQSTRAAGRRIFRFLGEPEEKEKPEALTLEKVEGYVDFSDVSFNYSADKPIIKNMNLKVDKNKMVAVVGPTGSGKTTLINLLVRFYDATSGSIKIDGVDIQDLKKENLRDIIGIVLQDSWLFNGTILENIRYGNLNATDEQVMEAAKQANVHDFIMAKKDGYQTVINEETANLSQGEKQLLTIARTLLRNPAILILDEATSTIDTRIEMILQESIQKLLSERTSFVIAHRLSTIVNADIIVVLENGVIIEQGTHQELLAKQGFYYNLYQSQFQKS